MLDSFPRESCKIDGKYATSNILASAEVIIYVNMSVKFIFLNLNGAEFSFFFLF